MSREGDAGALHMTVAGLCAMNHEPLKHANVLSLLVAMLTDLLTVHLHSC